MSSELSLKMLNQQPQIVNSIDPYIEPLIKRVLQTERLGICCGTIELESISSSCGQGKGDRFRLSIPYARQNLVWNVLFDSQYPDMGPDFIFNDDSFIADFDIDTLTSQVPSLAKWNPNDGNALLNVLIELLLCYKQHQIQQLVKQGDRLQLEYTTLVGSTEITDKDVEMILLPLGSKPTEARFLISLKIDVSQLPNRSNQSKTDTAMLVVTFYESDWTRIVPQLYLSKSLEEICGGPAVLHLPPFPPDKYLMDYVPEIKKFITEKINSVVQCFEKRRSFITALLGLQRNNVLEYDAPEFSYIFILLEHRDFFFVVQFYLPTGFPIEKPIITLQSIYHANLHGKLYTEILHDFPYSPRWEPCQMVNKLLTYIKEGVIQKFQANSIKSICSD